jgi:hypothetical protein
VETMATKKKHADEGRQIGVRLSSEDYERLEKLSARLAVGTIARVALLLGLEIIEKQPSVLIGDKPKART